VSFVSPCLVYSFLFISTSLYICKDLLSVTYEVLAGGGGRLVRFLLVVLVIVGGTVFRKDVW
jgi:hypothetical protein